MGQLNLKPYRLKHKATGLYYKPGAVNLSEKGKIYTSPINFKTWLGKESYPITIPRDSRIYEKYKDVLINLETPEDRAFYCYRVTVINISVRAEDFEVEYIE